MKYGFVYETTCLVTGMKYIGRRIRNFTPYDDEYLGSGKLLNLDIDKYGRENFVRVILVECDSKEELEKMERYYLEKVDAMHNPSYYNLTNSSIGWPTEKGKKLPEYWRAHMSESQRKRPPVTEETRRKLRIANTGKHHTEETRKKISDIQKGRKLSEEHKKKISLSNSGENNPWYGKSPSEETRRMMSESQKRRFSNETIYNKGLPMTEGQKVLLSESVTKLWEDPEYKKRQRLAHSGKVWMHKQETLEKVYILECEITKYEHDGWKRGRGKSCKRIK